MRRILGIVLAALVLSPALLADTQDTTVFRTRMLPDNEVPPVSLPGSSANATITVRVTRDGAGGINAATVIFDIDYTMTGPTTFVGLHIHNAPVGVNGSVVIDSGVSGTNSVSGTTGRILKTVNYSSADTAALGFVSGVLNAPELYYVNIHSVDFAGGLARGQMQRSTLTLRPYLSPSNEVPSITGLDAEAAGAVTIVVNRDAAGAITSGTVTFDIDYRFSTAATIVGLHLHKAAAGSNGGIVIDSGVSNLNSITTSTGRGNIFRVAEYDNSNSTALSTLAGILADPTQYYINLHTTVNPGGAMRGQLEKDALTFLSLMTGGEENPPVATTGTANAVSSIRVTRNAAGNITGGTVVFNVNFNFPSPVTFTGLHIHNAKVGVNGGILLQSGVAGGANSVSSDTGVGNITRTTTIDSTNSAGITGLNGLFYDPESYYVNIHSTTSPGGITRAQLARETYHFRPVLRPANENPPLAVTASGTGWVTIVVNRDRTKNITSALVTFDTNYAVPALATLVGMHIHRGLSTENGSVVIDSGLSGTNSAPTNDTGAGNVTRTVLIEPTNATGLATVADLIKTPSRYYLNVHTSANPGGLMRAQLLQFANFVTHVAGGGNWISSITLTNPSSTASAHGMIEFYDTDGNAMADAITDPVISFWIPPAGSATFNLHNRGTLTSGYARVYSNGAVNAEASYSFPDFTTPAKVTTVVGSTVTLPISVANGGAKNTGIAVLSLDDSPAKLIATLRDANGTVIASGSTDIGPNDHVAQLVTQLLASSANLSGTLTLESFRGPFGGGLFAVTAIQFDLTAGTLDPVTVTVVR